MSWLAIAATILVVLTVAVLFVGIGGFARGGEFNRRHGNRLMRFRVGFQFAALILLGVMFLLAAGG